MLNDIERDSAVTQPATSAHNICVARQPIFDSRLEVVAYELLYRDAANITHANFTDGAIATCRVVVAAVAEIGLETLCGKSVVHLNLPRELIIDPVAVPLSPERTVLEVLETVQSDDDVLAGIRFLRAQGFKIALDDYSSACHDESLVELADIVKVDLRREPAERLPQTAAALLLRGVDLIAEKVETREQFERCRALGFRRFQGYFFGRPETLIGRRAPSNRLTVLRVLAALQNPDVTPDAFANLVSQDLALLHRLLRFLNSGYPTSPESSGLTFMRFRGPRKRLSSSPARSTEDGFGREPLRSACLEESQRLCSGDQVHESADCLKSDSAKLYGKSREGASK